MANNQDRSSSRYLRPILVAAVILAVIGAFLIIRNLFPGEPGQIIPSQGGTPGITGEGPDISNGTDSSLSIRLSEGQDQPEAVEPLPLAIGEPLSGDILARILARLPALIAEPDDSQDFRLPEEVIPPPRTGETIEEAFPPPQALTGPGPVEAGPLEVLRYSPEGEIPIAPFVNITFNQPMVALATISDLAESDVPVQIEPDLPGTWRWLGTKTLNFQYDSELIDRMPMATEYLVTVPSGTESAIGGVLAETVQFSFSTPTVTMTTYYPSYTPQPRDPLFFVAFNQRINPEAVLETIEVTAGNQRVSIRMATAEEIAEDSNVSHRVESANEGRWLAFRAKELLPVDTNISIAIGPGTPSAEGPLVTQTQQTYNFQTYAPLRIDDHGCSWYDDECPPLTPFFIEFNNPLDLDAYDDSMLRINPELPGASVTIYGDTISIRGATAGRTTYRVTVDGDIQDVFGQKLGKDTVLKFKVGSAEPALIGPNEIFVTLDPAASDPALSIYAINHDKLEVKIYAVEPSDWPAFLEYMYEYQRTDTPQNPPGTLVLDETKRLETPADVLTEVDIDLSEYMDGTFGHFIVIVKPPRSIFEEDRYWETVQA